MAKNEFTNSKPTMFLGINGKEGLIYHRVREKDIEETEISRLTSLGYKRNVTQNPQTKEEVAAYYKFWPSVTGYVTGFKLDTESEFGERLSITIEDETERNVISMNLFGQNGSMNGYAADLARHVDNIPLNEQIIFGANRNLKNDKGYLVSILNLKYMERVNDLGPELIPRAISKEQLPPLVERQKGGKKTYNSDERDAFLYEYLQKFVEMVEKGRHHFGQNQSHDTYNPENTSAPTTRQTTVNNPAPSAPVSQEPQKKSDDFDDLPF